MLKRYWLLILCTTLFGPLLLFLPLWAIFRGTDGAWIAWLAFGLAACTSYYRTRRRWRGLFHPHIGQIGDEALWEQLRAGHAETQSAAAMLLWQQGARAKARLKADYWQDLNDEVKLLVLEMAAMEKDPLLRDLAFHEAELDDDSLARAAASYLAATLPTRNTPAPR